MATVQIYYKSHLRKHLDYVLRQGRDGGAVQGVDVDAENAEKEFGEVAEVWKYKGKHKFIELVQSWSPDESKKFNAEKFNEIGAELAKRYFPGHQAVVVTHTKTGKTHNHIIINPVSQENGKKIHNEFKHLHKLRTISDQICLENGMTVLQKTTKVREQNMPREIKEIVKRGGFSYILDLKDKADFARSLSTSFDEYAGFLDVLGIKVRVEKKNISYFYPGKDKAKRGSKLGIPYDKEGLIESFKTNDEKFKKFPELRGLLRGHFETMRPDRLGPLGDPSRVFLERISGEGAQSRDYAKFTKTSRDSHFGSTREFSKWLDDSYLGLEIKRAKESSILEYAKKHKIETTLDKEGRTVLKGREYVVIDGNSWRNTRNKTEGSAIDFVALHRGVSFLHAASILNNNARLRLLDKHLGETKKKAIQFKVPRVDKADSKDTPGILSKFLEGVGAKAAKASDLMGHSQINISKGGKIQFFGEYGDEGGVEWSVDENKRVKRKNLSDINGPFLSHRSRSNEAHVYLDPLSFALHRGKSGMQKRGMKHSTLVLFEAREQDLELFVGSLEKVDRVRFFKPEHRNVSERENDFMNSFSRKAKGLGIEVTTIKVDKAIMRDRLDLEL